MIKRVAFLVFALAMQSVTAQVTVRNDFVINGKDHKIKNKGITLITINLDRHQNLNYLINGRGGNVLRIDVDALRHPNKTYTYSEIAEKIYIPNAMSSGTPVPAFLLTPPPKRFNLFSSVKLFSFKN